MAVDRRRSIATELLTATTRWYGRRAVVRQYDQADCGPAALLAALRFHGGNSSLARVRELAGTDAIGTSLAGMARAAERLGFEVLAASGSLAELAGETLPCIAHVVNDRGQGHFVVVYHIGRSVVIGDPGLGRRRLTREAFASIWVSGAVLLLTPTAGLVREPPPSWIRWLLQYCAADSAWLGQTVFLGVMYTILGLSTSLVLKVLVDDVLPAHEARRLWLAAVLLCGAHVVRSTGGYLRQRFLTDLSARVSVRLTSDFLRHLYRLPASFFDTRSTGDITSRLTDAVKIQSTILRVAGNTLSDVLVVVGSLAFVAALSPMIGGLLAGFAVLYAGVIYPMTRPLQHQQGRALQAYARVESSYIDTLQGITTIAAFGAATHYSGRNAALFAEFQERVRETGDRQAVVAGAADLLSGMIVIGALILGAQRVIAGDMPLGTMLAIYSLTATALPSVTRLLDTTVLLQGVAVASTRLLELLLATAERDDRGAAFDMRESVALDGVTHAWGEAEPVLRDLTLVVRRGHITGLCGASGSGKSTLVSLLARRYDPTSGAVLVDGGPAAEVQLASYRRHVAVVSEHAKIFTDTLGGNILLGRDASAGAAQLASLIDQLHLGAFLARFPAGLATPIGDQARRLSSGERQLTALLRAMLTRPALLVMDEGLNGMDDDLSRMALAALTEYARDHAVLLVTHDAAALESAAYLYRMEGGRVTLVRVPDAGASADAMPASTHGYRHAARHREYSEAGA